MVATADTTRQVASGTKRRTLSEPRLRSPGRRTSPCSGGDQEVDPDHGEDEPRPDQQSADVVDISSLSGNNLESLGVNFPARGTFPAGKNFTPTDHRKEVQSHADAKRSVP